MSRTLQEIYADIPDVGCKGLCVEACGPIACTRQEADRMIAASGFKLKIDKTLTCGYLSNGRCTVYAVRPLVCRLYGAAESLPCDFGCRPTMSAEAAKKLLNELGTANPVWSETP